VLAHLVLDPDGERVALAAGKVPVKKTIVHKGKTITVTYWVNPDKKKHGEGGGGGEGGAAPEGGGGAPAPSSSAPPEGDPPAATPPKEGPKKVPIKKTIVTKSGKKVEVTYHVSEKKAAEHKAKEDAKGKEEGKPAEAKPAEAKPAGPGGAAAAGDVGDFPREYIKKVINGQPAGARPSMAYQMVETLGGNKDLARGAIKDWASSSVAEQAVILRGAVMGKIAGHSLDVEVDHILRADKGKAYHSGDADRVRELLNRGASDPQMVKTAHALAAVSQSMHGKEMVTLYRGIGDKTAGGLRASGSLRTGALVSWTDDINVAHSFGQHTVVATVPRSSIVASHRALAGNGGLLKNEKEVIIATHGQMTDVHFINRKTGAVEKVVPSKTGLRAVPGVIRALAILPAGARRTIAGLPVVIEYPAGSIRFHRGSGGEEIPVKMQSDYGYIDGYLGADGEDLDCYVGPAADADQVYVVHQLRAPDFRAHDEDKIMLAFPDAQAARAAYLYHRNDERAYQGMTVFPIEKFIGKLRRRAPGTTTKIRASALRGKPRRPPRSKQVYADRLRQRAQELAARALSVDLAALKAEVDRASSLEDARRRVVARYGKLPKPQRLAELVRKTDILAHLSGRFEALEEV
jgi:hypothetical protein